MGLLDQIAGALGGASGNGQSPLMQIVVQLIQQHPGGLQGLVEQFTKAGLGAQVQSWVGTGANLPVSADDLAKVFGGGSGPGQLLSQLGVDPQQALGGLAQTLPDVVNQLTPHGTIDPGSLEQGLGALLNRFG